MGSRKRGRDEMEPSEPAPEQSLLHRIRNTWELANLMQYIFIFGKAVKVDEDLTIEDLEAECLKPGSSRVLSDIGLALLKYLSSHRGLTHENFDEYTRRQYLAKGPAKNPFGDDEIPLKFSEFDVFTKLRILVQLSQWTLINADRVRQSLPEANESEQVQWRIEEIGYDRDERYYFLLDDNRLYRRTDPPPPIIPAAKPKANSKKGKAAARASKRRKTHEAVEFADDGDGEPSAAEPGEGKPKEEDDGFGGRKWECIAVTLSEYQEFLGSIQKSRDQDEKALHRRITEEVLPVIEKAEESLLKKRQKQERELMNMQKLATAKRSSRLEAKQERERQELEAVEAERKRKVDLVAAKQNQEKQKEMEEARESRMLTREQRIKEREYKRILHEEELANLSEENKKVETGEARLSERHLKTEMEKKKKELAALDEYDEWSFDCSKCGVHGTNLDDGTHSVACEKCNVWQHSACLGISQAEAEKDDFHFVCADCKRRAEDAMKPKIPSLKFHIGSSSSPPAQKPKVIIPGANEGKKRKSSEGDPGLPPSKKYKPVNRIPQCPNPQFPRAPPGNNDLHNGMHATVMNAPTLSPQGQVARHMYAGNQGDSFSTQKVDTEPVSPATPKPPSKPPIYTNGYSGNIVGEGSAGSTSRNPPQSSLPPHALNGHQQNNHEPQNVGWSARYTPPQPSQQQRSYGHSPSQNPFANSFERQPPSLSNPMHHAPSPAKTGPPMSSPRHHINASSPSIQHTPQLNGFSHHQPLSPTGPPVPSPVKQRSPPATQAPINQTLNHSSSPVAPKPALRASVSSSPGFSPTKQSPPRPAPLAQGMAAASVLPPAPQLSPSPMGQHVATETTRLPPEQVQAANGYVERS